MRRTTIFFILIFLVSLTIRLIYIRSHPAQILPDTYGYYLIGQRIMSGQLPIFNPQRTPGYPLFLQQTYALTGAQKAEINSVGFWRGASITTFIQSALSALGVTLVTWLFYRITKSLGLTITLGFLLASNILTFAWDSILVVESLATSWLIFSCVWVYITINNPTRAKMLSLVMLGWLGFLLKPVFVGLPIVWILFLGREAVSLREAKNERRGNPDGTAINNVNLGKLLIICLFILLPVIYVTVNNYYFHYSGINHVQDINLLGRVIKDRLDPAAGKKISPELTSQLSKYLKTNQPADPYVFLQTADPTLLVDDSRQADRNRLKPWVNTIILNNFPQYLTGVIYDLPNALPSAPVPQGPALQKPIAVFDLLGQLNSLLLVIFAPLILVLTIPAFIYWRKNVTSNTSIILTMHLTIWYILIATVAFGYGEYARLLTPVQPLVYFLGVWWIIKIKMQKLKWKITMQNTKF